MKKKSNSATNTSINSQIRQTEQLPGPPGYDVKMFVEIGDIDTEIGEEEETENQCQSEEDKKQEAFQTNIVSVLYDAISKKSNSEQWPINCDLIVLRFQ